MSVEEDGLILLDARRIYIPIGARQDILPELHKAHCGLEKTLATARKMYFWPGMRGQIKQMVQKCEACQVNVNVNLPPVSS